MTNVNILINLIIIIVKK